jgi:hypothetical protein
MMRIAWITLWLLLAAGHGAPAEAANADVQARLPNNHEQRGGLMALFAATVVEGGGGSRKSPIAVVDVSEEFPGQYIAPGRIKPGRQEAVFRIIASSQLEAERSFETPMNATRIIAFGDPGPPLVIYANHMYADTETNRAALSMGRMPPPSAAWSVPLFFASLGLAVIGVFVPWLSLRFGVLSLAAAVVLWIAYEATIPRQVNIRVDLLLLLPVMLAAAISLVAAAVKKRPGPSSQ